MTHFIKDRKGENNANAKLTTAQVFAIKVLINQGWKNGDLAEHYGVKKPTISEIRTGKRWGHVEVGK